MIAQFSAIIESVKANKDRTLMIKFETQELSPSDTSTVFEQMTKQVWVAVAEVPIKIDDLDIPESVNEQGEKTPSQRLRDRMFAYYKETHKDTSGFRPWYDQAMDKLGQEYLKKINP